MTYKFLNYQILFVKCHVDQRKLKQKENVTEIIHLKKVCISCTARFNEILWLLFTFFQEAKDYLTVESRQLVTSSKVLVRSCTLPKSPEFPANLAQCIAHLKKITDLCVRMSVHTAAPLQTRNLVLKVHDVLSVFRDLLTITDIHNDEVLTKRAESLAGVLATLLRSLRVFSP